MKWLIEYFNLSRGELRATIAIIVVLGIMICLQLASSFFFSVERMDFSEFEKDVNAFRAKVSIKDSLDKQGEFNRDFDAVSEELQQVNSPIHKIFNPNVVTKKELVEMGVEGHVAETWINYREKGGRFDEPEDVSKVYGLDKETYMNLKPYIKIPPKQTRKKTYTNNTFEDSAGQIAKNTNKKIVNDYNEVNLNLNTSDSAALTKVYGIGPTYASRILKYRKELGGFSNKDQLLEVYGIDSVNYKIIAEQVFIDSVSLKRISLNNADFKELIRHPYLDYASVLAIIRYRNKQDTLIKPEQLLKDKIISYERLEKVRPYLTD